MNVIAMQTTMRWAYGAAGSAAALQVMLSPMSSVLEGADDPHVARGAEQPGDERGEDDQADEHVRHHPDRDVEHCEHSGDRQADGQRERASPVPGRTI